MPSGTSSGFGSRREDRETALGILYAAETQGRENLEVPVSYTHLTLQTKRIV